MFDDIKSVSISEIRAAVVRLRDTALPTPLLRLDSGGDVEIFLKPENLQPVGSFKVRPIGNIILSRPAASFARGVYTSSSGNSALGVAWMARRLGIPATAVVPDNAPEAKLERLKQLGAKIARLTYDEWWHTIESGGHPAQSGLYIDAVRDPAALAGDGTIGLEIIEQMPGLDAIFVALGGGGLASGIACAVRALDPRVKIIACELTTAHPATNAFKAGKPVTEACDAGFVSGAGYASLLPEMWPLIREMIDGTLTVSLDEVASAVRLMAEKNKIIAEGAGAISVAAALAGRHGFKRVCAVVSGGNIGTADLINILQGRTPGR